VRRCARACTTIFSRLLADAGLTQILSETGYINVYVDDAELAGDQEQLALIRRFGFEMQTLDAAALHALEPALSSAIRHAILMPQGRTVADPYRLTVQLCERFGEAGGQRVRGEVAGFDERGGRVNAMRLGDGRRIDAAMVVIAAGVWSAPLARSLQEPIPLETERGYHTQFLAPGVSLRHSLFRPAKAFMGGPDRRRHSRRRHRRDGGPRSGTELSPRARARQARERAAARPADGRRVGVDGPSPGVA